MVHAAAQTDHPIRQAFWAIVAILVDTIIICTATAFVVLSSGVWMGEDAYENSSSLTTIAFTSYFGEVGSYLVTISLIFFVLSTILVIIYYGSKQAEFLFGLKASYGIQVVYLGAIVFGSVGAVEVIWGFLDIMLATVLIPNIIAILLLSNKVKELKTEFFTSEKYYLKDIAKKKKK